MGFEYFGLYLNLKFMLDIEYIEGNYFSILPLINYI